MKQIALMALAIAGLSLQAEVVPSRLFSDGAVLQREAPVNIWGKAEPGERVEVAFAGAKAVSVADRRGDWKVTLPAMKASAEPRELKIGPKTLKDVLVGDVFLYGGGNEAVAGFGHSWAPEKRDWSDEIAAAKASESVRVFMVQIASSLTPQVFEIPGTRGWQRPVQLNQAKEMPIDAWLLADRWAKRTGVPCGIVSVAGVWRYWDYYYNVFSQSTFPGAEGNPPAGAKSIAGYKRILRGFIDYVGRLGEGAAGEDDMAYASDAVVDSKERFGECFYSMAMPVMKYSYCGLYWVDSGRGWLAERHYRTGIRALFDGFRLIAKKNGAPDFKGTMVPRTGPRTEAVAQAIAAFSNGGKPEEIEVLYPDVPEPAAREPYGSKLEVSGIFTDHQVLQHGCPHPVWGRGRPGAKVKVSYQGRSATATVGGNGAWEAVLPPLDVQKTGGELLVESGGEKIVFRDVVCGDVWYSSGQSNSEMSLGWGCLRGDETKADAANRPLIRSVKISKTKSFVPVTFEVRKDRPWTVAASNTVAGFSAAGYYFARRIHAETGLPIGVIDDNWSGCRVQPFTPLCGMKTEPLAAKAIPGYLGTIRKAISAGRAARSRLEEGDDIITAFSADGGFNPQYDFCNQWNAMLEPIVRLPFKGVVWYQGCSNNGDGLRYREYMRALIRGWREKTGYEMPFYQVQLASYRPGSGRPEGDADSFAPVREAQRLVCDDLPKVGMATAIDIGNEADIHPKNKWDVGERLALWALRDCYGRKDLVVSGPWFERLSFEGAKARVHFKYVGSGLMVGDKDPNGAGEPVKPSSAKLGGFTVQDAAGKWHFAEAVIDGKTVVVSAPGVPEVKNVRYGYRASTLGIAHPECRANLYNREGLPAVPFRE